MAERTERGVLNHLIETCTDAARGFRTVAEYVHDPGVRAALLDAAVERDRFVSELLPHAQRLGGDAAADGTLGAMIHRGWIEIVSKVLHDDPALLREVTRGDGVTMHAFEDAVVGMLPPESRELIEREYADISTTHAQLMRMRDAAEPPAGPDGGIILY